MDKKAKEMYELQLRVTQLETVATELYEQIDLTLQKLTELMNYIKATQEWNAPSEIAPTEQGPHN